MRTRTVLAAALAATLFPLLPAPALAQRDGGEILREVIRRQERETTGVRDYTVTTTAFGSEVTFFFTRELVDGVEVWVPQRVGREDESNPFLDLGTISMEIEGMMRAEPHLFRFRAVEEVEGVPAYRVSASSAEVEEIAQELGATPGGEPMEITLWVDTAAHRVVQLGVSGFPHDEEFQFGRVLLGYDDFRTTGGVTLPHRTTVTIEDVVLPFDAAQLAQLRALIAASGPDALAQFPPAQRGMIEWIVDNGDEMLRTGRVAMEIRVSDVRVNTGPPPGVAEGP